MPVLNWDDNRSLGSHCLVHGLVREEKFLTRQNKKKSQTNSKFLENIQRSSRQNQNSVLLRSVKDSESDLSQRSSSKQFGSVVKPPQSIDQSPQIMEKQFSAQSASIGGHHNSILGSAGVHNARMSQSGFSQQSGRKPQPFQLRINDRILEQQNRPINEIKELQSADSQSTITRHINQQTISSEDRNGFDHLPPGYDQKVIGVIIYFLFFANLFFNIDMGILPAGSIRIKNELKLSNSQYGLLGSVVYFGQVLGSALASGLLQFGSPKIVLASCLFLNIGFLLVFTMTNVFWVLAASRTMTGLFQIFLAIYQPCWADVFGNEIQKSRWLTYLIITTPLGVVLGYSLCASFLENIGWKWAFYIQALLLLPSFLGILYFPAMYFDIQLLAKKQKEIKKQSLVESMDRGTPRKKKESEDIGKIPITIQERVSKPAHGAVPGQIADGTQESVVLDENVIRVPNDQDDHQRPSHAQEENKEQQEDYVREINQIQISMDFQSQISVSQEGNNPKVHNSDGKMIQYESRGCTQESEEEDSAMGEEMGAQYFRKMKQLMRNLPFLMLCLALTAIYFIVTGIQYWVSDYMITELKLPEKEVFITFAIVSITGPVLGVVVGGNLTTCLGGYGSKNALMLTLFTAVFCVGSAAPIPFVNEFPVFVCLLWFLLFLGGSMLPSMTGIMLSTVDKQFKTTANSIANLSYNLLGYLPAPSIYGLIYDSGTGGNARSAMATLMFTPIISLICLIAAAYLLVRSDVLQYKKQAEEKKTKRKHKQRPEQQI